MNSDADAFVRRPADEDVGLAEDSAQLVQCQRIGPRLDEGSSFSGKLSSTLSQRSGDLGRFACLPKPAPRGRARHLLMRWRRPARASV